jgi:hypothetical protein
MAGQYLRQENGKGASATAALPAIGTKDALTSDHPTCYELFCGRTFSQIGVVKTGEFGPVPS